MGARRVIGPQFYSPWRYNPAEAATAREIGEATMRRRLCGAVVISGFVFAATAAFAGQTAAGDGACEALGVSMP